MNGRATLKSLALACVLVVIAATMTVLGVGRDDRAAGRNQSHREEGASAPAKAKSSRVLRRTAVARSVAEREVGALALPQVRAQLPGALGHVVFATSQSKRTDLLFRRFGALLGEQALDEIIERYEKGPALGRAVALALAGWMEVDPDAAKVAFREFAEGSKLEPLGGLEWKGKKILSGFG